MYYIPLYIYFMAVSFLVSLFVYLRVNKVSYLKWFPLFLFSTVVIECVGIYLANKGKSNTVLYNFFTLFEFSYYIILISQAINTRKAKKILYSVVAIYLVIALFNIFFIQKNVFHSITYSLGCLLVVACSVYYFFELFQQPKSSSLLREPAFWICTGLLFYYSCSFPLMGAINFLNVIPPLLFNNAITFLTILNILLYSLFTIAFLCQLKIRKYTLS
jgi:hypothetical protein